VLSGVSGAQADTAYARPGQMVSVGTHRLNLYCMGTGSPTVVFDSGWEDWAPAWSVVQPRVATFTRACAYDRAGTGFSEAGPMPRTSMQIADELHTALQSAGVPGPFILVGHAFGGNNVRTFADRFMPEVAGLVLVEGDPSDLEPSEMREREHLGQKTIIARLRECRDSVAAGKSLPMLPARPGRPPRTCAQQFFRGLPETAWSPALNAKLLQLAQSKVAMYDAYISEMEQFPADEEYLQQHRQSLGSRPIRVLSSRAHGVGSLRTLTPAELKYESEVALAQGKWLQLSSNAKLVIADHSSEYIQFDQPDVVIEAIREVVSQKLPGEFLSVGQVLADSAERSCQIFGVSLWSQDAHEDGHCRVSGCSAAGTALRHDWVACEYERRWVLPASGPDPTDTVAENEVVLYRTESMLRGGGAEPSGRRFTPVWHERYEPDVLRSVTASATALQTGGILLAVRECLNGTGGCDESFAVNRRDSWRALRLSFLDSLERRYPGAVRHGFRVNPRTLTADVAIYSDGDPNCCPSRVALIQLRLRGDAFEMKAIRITAASRE
jgi:pimeloyl-ACP methyl ester carboxylesterase